MEYNRYKYAFSIIENILEVIETVRGTRSPSTGEGGPPSFLLVPLGRKHVAELEVLNKTGKTLLRV